MPSDLLLVAFALTLAVNAVFVLVAIRALRRGRFEPDAETAVRPAPGLAPRPLAARPVAGRREAAPDVARAVAAHRATLPEPGTAAAPPAARSLPPAPALPPVPEPDPTERSVATASASPGSPRPASGEGARPARQRAKGRRRFSLPPLDDDHEKVSRSIESFLSGSESAADGGPGADPGPAGSAATTVAMIAIVGVETEASAEDDAAAAMLERTLRSAARGTDSVEIEDRQRFRIVLPGTGELAARAYLRRVRATVEPLLEAARSPLRLVIATATVLDEPADAAAAVAGRRLDVAIAAARAGNEDKAAPDTLAAAD